MRCTHCDAENRPGARFCGKCGEPLEVVETPTEIVTCAVCGAPLKPGARFCPRCGADVQQPARVTPEGDSVGIPTRPAGSTGEYVLGRVPEPAWDAVPPSAAATGGSGARPTWGNVGPVPESVRGAVPSYAADTGGSTGRPTSEVPASRRRAPAWPLAIVMALLSGACFLCAVIGLAAAPALGVAVRPLPATDPTRADITILVEEAYISDRVIAVMPASIGGDARLDVQPGNRIVVAMEFPLLIIRLEVVITSRIEVEAGRMRVTVESVETGGQNILDLVGMDQIALGDEITGAIQKVLEDELGPGSQLLTITTDESRVILTARWE